MKKKIGLIAAIIVLIAIAIFVFSGRRDVAAGKPTVKIGVILPLSGDLANVGEAAKNAISMAIGDANKNTDNKYFYKLVIDDDRFEVKKDALLANKQITSDGVKAIIGFASTPGLVVAPIAEKGKVIYVNVGASDLNVAAGKYNFIHWTTPDKTTSRLVEFFSERGYKNIAIVSSIDAGFSTLEQGVVAAAKKSGIKTKTFEVNPAEKDFRPILAHIKAMNADAIVAGVWGAQLPILVKQYHESGLKLSITNTETFAMAPDFTILEGAYFTDVAQSGEEFNARLKREFPKTASDFATGNFYDAVMLIVNAFEKVDTSDAAVDALRATRKYDGIVGHLTQDDHGVFQSTAVLKQIKNGKAEIVK